jgi:hypothetical protein
MHTMKCLEIVQMILILYIQDIEEEYQIQPLFPGRPHNLKIFDPLIMLTMDEIQPLINKSKSPNNMDYIHLEYIL